MIPQFSKTDKDQEKIYQAMHELEGMTRQYIEKLLKSRESADSHARFLTAILDSIGDGLIVVDANKTIILANQAAIKIVGWEIANLSHGELRKRYKRFKEDGHTPMPEEDEPMSIALKEGHPSEMINYITSDHLPPEGVWIRTLATPVKNDNDEIIGGVTIIQDITNAVKLRNQRDALATLITHDLKNHLIAESGILEVLADELAGKLKPEISDMLTEQVASNYRYLELASTLLELSRTEMLVAKESIQSIAMQDLLDSVVELSCQLASNLEVTIEVQIEPNLPPIKGVFAALQQVFHNLLQNAIHVSDAGQTITIKASKSGHSIVTEIADNGPGIPEEKLKRLFDPTAMATYVRASSTSTGVGLYLCRLLLDAHGGKLTCSSIENRGTSFFVELPI